MAKKIINLFIGSVGSKFTEWQTAISLENELKDDLAYMNAVINTADRDAYVLAKGVTTFPSIEEVNAAVKAASEMADTAIKNVETKASDVFTDIVNSIAALTGNASKPTILKESLKDGYKDATGTDKLLADIPAQCTTAKAETATMDMAYVSYIKAQTAYTLFKDGIATGYDNLTQAEIDAKLSQLKAEYQNTSTVYQKAKDDALATINAVHDDMYELRSRFLLPDSSTEKDKDGNYICFFGLFNYDDADVADVYSLITRSYANRTNVESLTYSADVNSSAADTLLAGINIQYSAAVANADKLQAEFKGICPTYFEHTSKQSAKAAIGKIVTESQRILSAIKDIDAETQDILYDLTKITSKSYGAANTPSTHELTVSLSRIITNAQKLIQTGDSLYTLINAQEPVNKFDQAEKTSLISRMDKLAYAAALNEVITECKNQIAFTGKFTAAQIDGVLGYITSADAKVTEISAAIADISTEFKECVKGTWTGPGVNRKWFVLYPNFAGQQSTETAFSGNTDAAVNGNITGAISASGFPEVQIPAEGVSGFKISVLDTKTNVWMDTQISSPSQTSAAGWRISTVTRNINGTDCTYKAFRYTMTDGYTGTETTGGTGDIKLHVYIQFNN